VLHGISGHLLLTSLKSSIRLKEPLRGWRVSSTMGVKISSGKLGKVIVGQLIYAVQCFGSCRGADNERICGRW
jgi:hypothetical protein